MTAPTDQSQFVAAVNKPARPVPFQELRGDFLDAFCDLELAVSQWLHFLGTTPPVGAAFGNRMMELAGHGELAARVGKNQLKYIQQLPISLTGIVETRNALVHGVRRTGMMEGDACVFIQNIHDVVLRKRSYVAVTEAEFRESIALVKTAASRLDSWLRQKLNPVSSPLPPSPDAAGDP